MRQMKFDPKEDDILVKANNFRYPSESESPGFFINRSMKVLMPWTWNISSSMALVLDSLSLSERFTTRPFSPPRNFSQDVSAQAWNLALGVQSLTGFEMDFSLH